MNNYSIVTKHITNLRKNFCEFPPRFCYNWTSFFCEGLWRCNFIKMSVISGTKLVNYFGEGKEINLSRSKLIWSYLKIFGVDFINVLRAAFAHVDPKSGKRYWEFDWILTLTGYTHVKAVHRTLMKLRPGWH